MRDTLRGRLGVEPSCNACRVLLRVLLRVYLASVHCDADHLGGGILSAFWPSFVPVAWRLPRCSGMAAVLVRLMSEGYSLSFPSPFDVQDV